MKFTRLLSATLIAALFISLVSACGSGETQEQEQSSSSSAASATATANANADAEQPDSKLNLNRATEDEFLTIPGVGERMVGEFMEYRPYVSIRQFRREIGKYVDEEQVAAYEKYVFVPIDRNESDAATLQQIPGLDETETKELIDGRPYDSNSAFLDQLSDFLNQDELSTAETYLATE